MQWTITQPKTPHMYMCVCIYTWIHTQYYSAIGKNEAISFATTWMDLLSEKVRVTHQVK